MNGERIYNVKEKKQTTKSKESKVPSQKRTSTKEKSPMGTAFDGGKVKKVRAEKTEAPKTKTSKKQAVENKTAPKKTTTKKNLSEKAPKKRISSPKNSDRGFVATRIAESIPVTPIQEKKTRKTLSTAKKKEGKQERVKILFLGGVGEIGKNMTAIEYNYRCRAYVPQQ